VVAVTIVSYGNIIVTVKRKIQLVEIMVFAEATVMKTTEAAASVASNVATAMNSHLYTATEHKMYKFDHFVNERSFSCNHVIIRICFYRAT